MIDLLSMQNGENNTKPAICFLQLERGLKHSFIAQINFVSHEY